MRSAFRHRVVVSAALLGLLPLRAFAENAVIKLTSGGELEGAIVRETDAEVVVRLKTCTVNVPRDQIVSVKKDKEAVAPVRSAAPTRLPSWEVVADELAKRSFGKSLRQIPATVVDVGVLKYVPYLSHQAGDYEINVYGDPHAPACVEIGIVEKASKTQSAKEECQAVMLAVLHDEKDREALRSLHMITGSVKREGVTLEITPPTAEDAYGGWWISVYDEKALDSARAKKDELASITVKEREAKVEHRKSDPYAWAPSDYSSARPQASEEKGEAGRTVYVRGYTRKDGTYVAPHTRSAPGSGGGSRHR